MQTDWYEDGKTFGGVFREGRLGDSLANCLVPCLSHKYLLLEALDWLPGIISVASEHSSSLQI